MNPNAVTDEITEFDGADAIENLLGDDLDTIGAEPNVEVPQDAEPAAVDEDDTDEADVEGNEEPDSEEDEGDGDEEGEGEEDPNPAISDETLVDIQIGDETYEVNFAELRAGYLRQEEFVSKVNEQEAAYLEKSSQLEELQAQLTQELQQVAVMMTGDTSKYDRINWQALKEADPAKYNELRVEATEAKERAQQITQRKTAIEQMHQKAQELRHAAYLKGQVQLAEKIVPGFREPAFFDDLVKFGKNVGYSQQEIEGIVDARQLLILNNARLYAEGVVKKKAAMESNRPAKELPPALKPGVRKSDKSAVHQQSKRASARLNSEKSVDAAAAYLMTLEL